MEAQAATRPAGGSFDAGSVEHLLPTATHDRLRLKASFERRLSDAPRLRLGGRTFTGRQSDTEGRFWHWDVSGLDANRRYGLRLLNGRGRNLTEPWSIRTFPAPNARPDRLRLLIFTCAGGHDLFREFRLFKPVRSRHRLLRRGLSFDPDAVIANGDHVYFDLEAGAAGAIMGGSDLAKRRVGRFNPSLPALGSANERVLQRAAGPQIVPLYGTECRSVPTFFLTDDHDYFENDEASDRQLTFPPPWWKIQLARATQRLYYPEFLPVRGQPEGLPWTTSGGSRRGLSEIFGALRYGRLLEFMMYEVRRTQTLAGPSAVFVDPEAERWITNRVRGSDATHVVTMPSNPFGWTAGKWGEWYPDVLVDGRLRTDQPKPFWQTGWLAQHDRIMNAIADRQRGVRLVVGGDIHATAAGVVTRSGDRDMSSTPIQIALSGTLGTDQNTFPSGFRGTPPRPSGHLTMNEQIQPLEENGFMIADFTSDRVVMRFFRWNGQNEADIDKLEPFQTIEVPSA